jgi:hypothetical protein
MYCALSNGEKPLGRKRRGGVILQPKLKPKEGIMKRLNMVAFMAAFLCGFGGFESAIAAGGGGNYSVVTVICKFALQNYPEFFNSQFKNFGDCANGGNDEKVKFCQYLKQNSPDYFNEEYENLGDCASSHAKFCRLIKKKNPTLFYEVWRDMGDCVTDFQNYYDR